MKPMILVLVIFSSISLGQEKTSTHFGVLSGKDDSWDIITKNGTKLHLWLPTVERKPEDGKKALPVDPKIIDLCKKLNGQQVVVESLPSSIVVGTAKGILVRSIRPIPKKERSDGK